MKKNKLAGKFSLLHRLNTDTVIIGLLPGINVNELTSTDLRYLAAFYLGGAVYRNSMVTGKIFKDYCGPSKYPIGNYAKVLQVTAEEEFFFRNMMNRYCNKLYGCSVPALWSERETA